MEDSIELSFQIYYEDTVTPLLFGSERTITDFKEFTCLCLDCNPSDILCGIAPSICKDCYEVSGDVAEEFIKAFGDSHKSELLRPSIFNPNDKDKYMLDLWAACRLVFLEAGIPEEHIEITNYCTRCNPKLFYSHRIMGANRGSLAAFISL